MKYVLTIGILAMFLLAGCGTGFVVAPLDEVTPQDKECVKERLKVQGEKDQLDIKLQLTTNDYNNLKSNYDILLNQDPDCSNIQEALTLKINQVDDALVNLEACQTANTVYVNQTVYVNDTVYVNQTVYVNNTEYILNETALEECEFELEEALELCIEVNTTSEDNSTEE
jgi:hypothetical protein